MKATIAILLLGAVMVLAEEKYDGHTIEEIIADDNLRKDYFECLMDTKECTADGEELKSELNINFFFFWYTLRNMYVNTAKL